MFFRQRPPYPMSTSAGHRHHRASLGQMGEPAEVCVIAAGVSRPHCERNGLTPQARISTLHASGRQTAEKKCHSTLRITTE